MSNLALQSGTRLRTGGATYEVTEDASIPAGLVPVVPQAARLLKVYCATCGYTVRVTQRWITKAGTPICPTDHEAMVVAEKPEKAEPVEVKSEPKPKVKKVAKSKPEPEHIEVPPDIPVTVHLPPPVEGDSHIAQILAELPAD
jgi:hypothetical protein